MNRIKKALSLFVVVVLLLSLAACGGKEITPDYADAASFEAALNNGEDLTGKTVQFTVSEVIPDSAFGYNLLAGDHLNFCSSSNPKVSAGDTVIVEVTEVSSLLGSYIISYEMK